MNPEPPNHAMLTTLTIQIAKTQLLLRELRRAGDVDPERIIACLEEIERLSWRLAQEIVVGQAGPIAS